MYVLCICMVLIGHHILFGKVIFIGYCEETPLYLKWKWLATGHVLHAKKTEINIKVGQEMHHKYRKHQTNIT